ncbi:MAG: hypothetical protein COA79_04545 [Planctomycetota bacterium]|nr:MAG: hypothetical protein COA79_04545 [Planctomycetota bacterium]
MPSSDKFYEDLKGFKDFSHFTHLKYYQALPEDWYVIITDIQGSTKAIQEGRYKDVNALGGASIVALLNAIKPLKVPYVFGGDGSTICIPPSAKDAVDSALVATQLMAETDFSMNLRIGVVPMSVLKAENSKVLVGKYLPRYHFQQAMFRGGGLGYAETLVKDPRPDNPYLITDETIKPKADFEGFECRWNEIPSPKDETVSILVQVTLEDPSDNEKVYVEVSRRIIEIYGEESDHHPLQEDQLTLNSNQNKHSAEVRIRTAFQSSFKRWLYSWKLKLLVNIGKFLMSRNIKADNVNWGGYKKTLIANTDYRKFDEVLRMIISGTKDQRFKLDEYLENLHKEKKVVYGIHASPCALITCLINNYDMDHIHFVDGSNGGYAMAAKGMKQQIKDLK